ncbi:low temperature requirement protein A [Cryobacterium zongtaii]|uniref:Low temperature requirement protein A n=1 Tax=Cryobacterium zongtaii TaxID=1259217 RepID=A0A2S3ZE38_9MICO|nr:low temperature requirement protein A [Cryobacterium zongtaii]POH64819.1 low temperature requirement protein A [Cryobacterium zongtaii]
MTDAGGFRLHRRMSARDTGEAHRAASPLELLFDLTFVVAVAQLVVQLAHGIEGGHGFEEVGPFLMVFFAIWWAWMNFTWFASAYDTDDVPYRLLTMLQMGGVLVLAAGVPAAFTEQDFRAITLGYLIMRIGLVAQWLRAGFEHPASRVTAWRYAAGVSLVQLGWLARLALPEEVGVLSFLVFAALDLAVPLWAERTGMTFWHPHHISERYGLFTIILLGESVLAATYGVQDALSEGGVSGDLVLVSAAALVTLFAIWWLYFLEPAGEGLSVKRSRSFLWGYGHYSVFAALAALGAGLEVAVAEAGHHLEVSPVALGYAVALPAGVFLVLLWAVHAVLVSRSQIQPLVILPAAALVLLVPLLASVTGVTVVVVLVATVCVLVVAITLADRARRSRSAAEAGQSFGTQ